MDEIQDCSKMPTATVALGGKLSFFGCYDHTIDGKGRIIIPNAFRKPLGDSFTLTVDLDDAAIAIYPDAEFERMVSELYSMNRRKPLVQKQQDHIAKFSYPSLQADSQGRVMLPAKLRQYVLKDAKDVEISGALDHVRIVASKAAMDDDRYYQDNREEILNAIGDLDI